MITPQIEEEGEWPQALRQGFAEALKNHETGLDVKIEMAGNECFETVGCLDTENILLEQGVAFKLPLKVHVTGPFLEKLGGNPCYIGSDEHPIHINLTTEGPGASGTIAVSENFGSIFLRDSRLVDESWHISLASGAKGCGGEYEHYVDNAIDRALEVVSLGTVETELPNKHGIVVLEGDLHDANTVAVRKEAAKGKV